jgi:hypothetical protein
MKPHSTAAKTSRIPMIENIAQLPSGFSGTEQTPA